jgi:hypothetical protein
MKGYPPEIKERHASEYKKAIMAMDALSCASLYKFSIHTDRGGYGMTIWKVKVLGQTFIDYDAILAIRKAVEFAYKTFNATKSLTPKIRE